MTDRETIAEQLLAGLRQDIIERRIGCGFALLDKHSDLLAGIDPHTSVAAQLLWRLAQWVDVGWRDHSVVHCALLRVPRYARSSFALRDYAAIRMAEGMLCMSGEDADEAIAHFDSVLAFEPDMADREMLSVANFWKARCQRKKGEYDDALKHAIDARDIAIDSGFERMAAVMRVLESWLCFQKGRYKEALKILAETESVLQGTDDALVLGNIQSTYGRIYRQEGRYDRAIHHFANANEEFRKVDQHHPHLVRTLANMAYVKRLVALECKRKLDTELARRRQEAVRGGVMADSPQAQLREQFVRLRDEAFADLDEAVVIVGVHPNHRGAGTVHLNRGLLHLDNGALDVAEEQAAVAYSLGEEKQDHILMARARLLQCIVENAKVEEGIEGDPRPHAQAALDYIRDAVELARSTQNRRLLARVHTWYGLTLSNEYFNDVEAATHAMGAASSFLEHGYHDTAWQDLRILKGRVVKSQPVDDKLRAWSQGEVGNRTFQQLEEEFAEIVIPKIWEREGRKISRVAAKLSISPKKIRRALSRAGLIRAHAGRTGAASAAE